MGFGGISIWSLLLLIGVLLLFIIPVLIFGPIAKKSGYSKWWSLIFFVPILNIAIVWVFAFIKWPVENAEQKIHVA
jgi:hypothetical protein